MRSPICAWASVIAAMTCGTRVASAMPRWNMTSARRKTSKSSGASSIWSVSDSSVSTSSGVMRSHASATAPLSTASRQSTRACQSSPTGESGGASGGFSVTKVPPPRPRTDCRWPDWTSAVIAWRRVDRAMSSWSASSRSGGRRVRGGRSPRRIATPRRSTVSSNVVGGWTGEKTAARAGERASTCRDGNAGEPRAVGVDEAGRHAVPVWRATRVPPWTAMSSVATPITLDRGRIAELTERETRRLDENTAGSGEMFERAHRHLSGGVASSYQLRDPWPIYLERGDGPKVWDVDGNEMWDFHNGFGSMMQGHAHPAIGRAVSERYARGTHFPAPTEDAIVVADELARRWEGLPRWRYANSGSESTMDAIRIARAFAKRDTVMKIFGSYHGHHDTVMVSIGVPYDAIGDREELASLPYGAGIPQAVVEMTVPVPFNDADAMERRIAKLGREDRLPACVIMEAAMMNLGVVLPEPGYLEAVREITQRHGIVLIFDEVKTGLTIAPGGARDRFGVLPDMVTLAKSLGGGLPTGAIGGTEEVMSVVEDGSVYQVGTYNGNPLGMAAARANVLDVLTPDAYAHLDALNDRIVSGCQKVIDDFRLPGYAIGVGAKGCVTFATSKIVDYETFKSQQDVEVTELAWAYNMNRGIFMTPGREEEWTLSVTHTAEAVDHFVAVFRELAGELAA